MRKQRNQKTKHEPDSEFQPLEKIDWPIVPPPGSELDNYLKEASFAISLKYAELRGLSALADCDFDGTWWRHR